ncbi:MAG: hypothetical protein HQ517_11540 [SAR324 cluster bacterium]|nr:hypothetical protein [SAR324 cluster bacterium]
MSYFDYTNLKRFVHDLELIQLLCLDKTIEESLELFTKDDFLQVDGSMNIPFFAEIRDYQGATEVDNPDRKWLVKTIRGNNQIETEMAMIVYFIDVFTQTLSVPAILTKIDGTLYRATKMIIKAEQLSGANYTVYPELKEQLLLDMVNRWIYCDEDRNPNNYLLRYNSKNQNLILAIDFGNSDILAEEIKVKGLAKEFGWQRTEKTRYLTPLKAEHFTKYGMDFFDMRFKFFQKLTKDYLLDLGLKVMRCQPEKERYSEIIAKNIMRRISYVHKYFVTKIPREQEEIAEHTGMGKTFQNM